MTTETTELPTGGLTSPKPGCSTVVVAMIAILAFVVGLMSGVGGFFGILSTSDDAIYNLKLAQKPQECPAPVEKECPACEKTAQQGGQTYALVYPIEETLRIEGDLTKETLQEVLLKKRFALQKCYQTELDKSPTTKGEMALQFTISSKGNIMAAVARLDTTNNANLKSCVLENLKLLSFKDEVKKQTVVKVDVLFAPLGSGGP